MDHLTRVLVLCGTPSDEYLNKIKSSEVCVSYILSFIFILVIVNVNTFKNLSQIIVFYILGKEIYTVFTINVEKRLW